MGTRAMYPGTFDPFTNGHEDLVRRACRLFEHVVVAIGANPGKTPIFTLEQRIDMARRVLADVPNVEVASYTGLTVEFAEQRELDVIVRGLRAVSDFEFEFQLATMNLATAKAAPSPPCWGLGTPTSISSSAWPGSGSQAKKSCSCRPG